MQRKDDLAQITPGVKDVLAAEVLYASHFALEDNRQFVNCSSPALLYCPAAGVLTICATFKKNVIVA